METNENKKLFELEMLMNMYCKEGELKLDDMSCYTDLQSVVNQQNDTSFDGSPQAFNRRLRYVIKLESVQKSRIELTFDLPSDYPSTPPDVSFRCNDLNNRESTDKLFSDLQHYIKMHKVVGEPAVLDIVQWTIENIDNYVEMDKRNSFKCSPLKDKTDANKSKQMCRYWIYSHHIYNKNKRKTILELAKTLDLDGFCCPGKPGVICVEGSQTDADDFWQKIRSLQWQRIMLKHQEICENENKLWKKFNNFEELCFQAAGCRDGHTDTSLLLEFLTSKNCQYVFPMYFGVTK